MSLRIDNNFGLFSGSGGGGGGAGVVYVGAVGINGISITGSPVTSCGTFGITNTAPYNGEAVEVLGSGVCSTLRCGVSNTASGYGSASLGGQSNYVSSDYGTIVGGLFNTNSGYASFIGGGQNNYNSGFLSSIGGGSYNYICNDNATIYGNTIGGGIGNNTQGGTFSSISGQWTSAPTEQNINCYTFIGGGFQNISWGNYSSIGGGCANQTCGDFTFIGGGCGSCAIFDYSSIGGGATNKTCGNYSTIVGGRNNITRSDYSSISGGCANIIGTNSENSTIGGGFVNCILGSINSFIGGGCKNIIDIGGGGLADGYSSIIGGYNNTLSCSATNSNIEGGQGNKSNDNLSNIVSGVLNYIGDDNNGNTFPFLCTDPIDITPINYEYIYLCNNVTSQFPPSTIISYYHSVDKIVYTGLVNSATYDSGTNLTCIGGVNPGTVKSSVGWARNIDSELGTSSSLNSIIVGGYANTIYGYSSAPNSCNNIILNGQNNRTSKSTSSFIGNGYQNTISGYDGFQSSNSIFNGCYNTIGSYDNFSTIINGLCNVLNSNSNYGNSCNRFIGNGFFNCIGRSGNYQTIVNGSNNKLSGYSAFIGSGICNNLYDNTNSGIYPQYQLGSVIVGGVGNGTVSGTFDCTTLTWSSSPSPVDASCFNFIGGGFQNIIYNSPSEYAIIVGGCCNVINQSQYSFIGGGKGNSTNSSYCGVIVGGINNFLNNSASAFIGGGIGNNINTSPYATIGGGYINTICQEPSGATQSAYAFIGGGRQNTISGNYNGVIGGGFLNAIRTGTLFPSNSENIIGGGSTNTIGCSVSGYNPDVLYSFIGGGYNNCIDGNSNYSTIIGGQNNWTGGLSNVHLIGSNITASDRNDATYIENLNIVSTPNTISGGDVLAWNSGDCRVVIKNGGIGLTSVGLVSQVSAFSIANSPITSLSPNTTICISGNGLATQYIRGDGTLATFPIVSGGGGGATYYFNGTISVAQPSGYYQMSRTASFGTQTTFTNTAISDNSPFVNFITCVGDPQITCVPGGIWEYNAYMSVNNGNAAQVQANVFKWCQSQCSGLGLCYVIGTGQPVTLVDGNTTSLYTFSTAVQGQTLATNDRLGVSFCSPSSGGNIVSLFTEGTTLGAVQTTLSTGISSINGLSASSQFLCTTTLGTDFTITSTCCTHCFNLPNASASVRGALSSSDWSRFNGCLSPTFPASSFYVNNTNATATAISATYCESGELVMPNTGNILWCTTAGAVAANCPIYNAATSTYRFVRVGNFVSLQVVMFFNIATTPAAVICGLEVQLPSTVPPPILPSFLSTQTCAVVVVAGVSSANSTNVAITNTAMKGALTTSSTSTSIYAICWKYPGAVSSGTCVRYYANASYLTNSIT